MVFVTNKQYNFNVAFKKMKYCLKYCCLYIEKWVLLIIKCLCSIVLFELTCLFWPNICKNTNNVCVPSPSTTAESEHSTALPYLFVSLFLLQQTTRWKFAGFTGLHLPRCSIFYLTTSRCRESVLGRTQKELGLCLQSSFL